MKEILTGGITYISPIGNSREWYWGNDYLQGDLYEAEELYKQNSNIKSNRLILVHFPNGEVFEPVKPQDNCYFGYPAMENDKLYILQVNFEKSLINIYCFSTDNQNLSLVVSIPLSEAKDCYNLILHTSPLMLTRDNNDNKFQIIYPVKTEFEISERESFSFMDDGKMVFNIWHEDPIYREETVIRKFPTGEIISKTDGTPFELPDGKKFILK